jgi:iron(III) transport system substrate-binding protein
MTRFVLALLVLLSSLGPALSQQQFGDPSAPPNKRLVIWGSTDLEAFGPVIAAFLERNPGAMVEYHDINTNELFAQSEMACEGTRPAADLVVSSAIDLQIRLVNEDCAMTHRSDETARLPPWASWRDQVFGLTFEPVVTVYNRELLDLEGLELSRFDLVDMLRSTPSQLDGKLVTYDIEMSGVGYLFAFMDSLQATTFGRLTESFGRNHIVATCCAAEMLDAVAGGKYLLAYNMLGSYAIARAKRDPRLGVLYPEDYTLVLSRAGFIPRGAPNPVLASAFLDFVLSDAGKAVLAQASLIIRPHEELANGQSLDLPGESSLRPITPSPVLLVGLDREKRRIFEETWRSTIGPAQAAP